MRLCFIGDSIVNGTGDDEALGWPGRVVRDARRQGHDLTFYNLGIRRDTSADIAARWHNEVGRRLPVSVERRLAFSFGANDCVSEGDGPRVPFERALANTETIARAAQAFAPTLMIGPCPVLADAETDRRVRALSEAQGERCRSIGVPFLAVFDFVAACDTWRREAAAGDGTHPNAGGYGALAGFIAEWPAFRSWLGIA